MLRAHFMKRAFDWTSFAASHARSTPPTKPSPTMKSQMASRRQFSPLFRGQYSQGFLLINQGALPGLEQKRLNLKPKFLSFISLKFFRGQGPEFHPRDYYFFPDLSQFLAKSYLKVFKILDLFGGKV